MIENSQLKLLHFHQVKVILSAGASLRHLIVFGLEDLAYFPQEVLEDLLLVPLAALYLYGGDEGDFGHQGVSPLTSLSQQVGALVSLSTVPEPVPLNGPTLNDALLSSYVRLHVVINHTVDYPQALLLSTHQPIHTGMVPVPLALSLSMLASEGEATSWQLTCLSLAIWPEPHIHGLAKLLRGWQEVVLHKVPAVRTQALIVDIHSHSLRRLLFWLHFLTRKLELLTGGLFLYQDMINPPVAVDYPEEESK